MRKPHKVVVQLYKKGSRSGPFFIIEPVCRLRSRKCRGGCHVSPSQPLSSRAKRRWRSVRDDRRDDAVIHGGQAFIDHRKLAMTETSPEFAAA
jgi:hypothetical protein